MTWKVYGEVVRAWTATQYKVGDVLVSGRNHTYSNWLVTGVTKDGDAFLAHVVASHADGTPRG